jgi:hypothetical protein
LCTKFKFRLLVQKLGGGGQTHGQDTVRLWDITASNLVKAGVSEVHLHLDGQGTSAKQAANRATLLHDRAAVVRTSYPTRYDKPIPSQYIKSRHKCIMLEIYRYS